MDGAFVHRCRGCTGTSDDGDDQRLLAVTRPETCRVMTCRCGDEIPLHAARPVAMASGAVEMCCSKCVAGGLPEPAARCDDEAEPPDVADTEPPRRSRWVQYTMGAVSLTVLVLVWWHVRGEKRASAAGRAGDVVSVRDADTPPSPLDVTPEGPRAWDLEPTDTVEDQLEDEGEPLHYLRPTLADWVHPVPGVKIKSPTNTSRRFGAFREGIDRVECGKGHCGVDLMGPRGQPIVAVAWGVVVRVEHNSDRRSGKFVRIEHPDFVYTSYMHLDDISPKMFVGAEVEPGQVVGTLGRTGIKHSAAHLHFALDITEQNRRLYVDPAPYLLDATVLDMFRYTGPRSARRSEKTAAHDTAAHDDTPTAPSAGEASAGQPTGEATADKATASGEANAPDEAARDTANRAEPGDGVDAGDTGVSPQQPGAGPEPTAQSAAAEPTQSAAGAAEPAEPGPARAAAPADADRVAGRSDG